MVLAFHSFMAYMASQPESPPAFDAPPYDWTAHPVIDSHRWLGFDLFGAFQFLYLMQAMFFLSGLFVWPSLARKGAAMFLRDRALRLGVPFVVGVFLLMPVAYFPVYAVGAIEPSWAGFWAHWTALPFWPSGPIWFLWFVLVLNAVAAGLYGLAPRAAKLLDRVAAFAAKRPERFIIGLVAISALIYLPMAARFEPWQWTEYGPFAFQPGLAPQYVLYFFAGLAAGALGIERSFLTSSTLLSERWVLWLMGTFTAFLLWVAAAALIMKGQDLGLPGVGLARDLAVVLFPAAATFGSAAIFLRFSDARVPFLASISENAYGIYLCHYVFVIWTQYLLLRAPLPAVAKGVIVLIITLALSWIISLGVNSIPLGARVLRGERRASLAKAQSTAERSRPI
jgi:hypothetical protein